MSTGTQGNMGIRIILFMGIGTFLFLMLVSFGVKQSLKPQEDTRVPDGDSRSPFDASRAWQDLEHLVGLGPRPSQSEGMEMQQAYIQRELRRAGLSVQRMEGEIASANGPVKLVNLRAVVTGTLPGVILLSTHYDSYTDGTNLLPDANGSASGTAWLLEMARTLGPTRDGRSLWLVFYDGNSPADVSDEENGWHGSRLFFEQLSTSGELASVDGVLNVASVGDCYLNFSQEKEAPRWLTECLWNTANRQGYGQHFGPFSETHRGDHSPFRAAGIPALALRDSSYGGSPVEHAQNWRTPADTLEKLCPGSLRAVGDVIYHALPVIDGQLNTTGTPTDGH